MESRKVHPEQYKYWNQERFIRNNINIGIKKGSSGTIQILELGKVHQEQYKYWNQERFKRNHINIGIKKGLSGTI